jgi:hypothetical protein
VRIRPEVKEGIDSQKTVTPAKKGQEHAASRLYALRELMMMEIPDRWSDVLLTEVPSNPATALTPAQRRYAYFLDGRGVSETGRTDLANVYLRRYAAIANRTNSLTGDPNTRDEILANQGAECLYMIITLATGDGEARQHFGENSIGDTDGDGAPEFLDGWGNPINFLRWAPGFDSQIQLNANTLGTPPNPPRSANPTWTSAAAGDHDPYDMYRVDPAAFRLVPLIYSAGGDETYSIYQADSYVRLEGLPESQLNNVPNPTNWRIILPWSYVDDPESGVKETYLGTADVEGATDNVHNHLLGLRGRP